MSIENGLIERDKRGGSNFRDSARASWSVDLVMSSEIAGSIGKGSTNVNRDRSRARGWKEAVMRLAFERNQRGDTRKFRAQKLGTILRVLQGFLYRFSYIIGIKESK